MGRKIAWPVADDVRREEQMSFRVTKAEKQEITEQARCRNLNTGEYLRRAVLKRSAKVRIETEMILAIRDVAAEIRQLHKGYVEIGEEPPEEALRVVLISAVDAMISLGKY